jgi:hypothetical protein
MLWAHGNCEKSTQSIARRLKGLFGFMRHYECGWGEFVMLLADGEDVQALNASLDWRVNRIATAILKMVAARVEGF